MVERADPEEIDEGENSFQLTETCTPITNKILDILERQAYDEFSTVKSIDLQHLFTHKIFHGKYLQTFFSNATYKQLKMFFKRVSDINVMLGRKSTFSFKKVHIADLMAKYIGPKILIKIYLFLRKRKNNYVCLDGRRFPHCLAYAVDNAEYIIEARKRGLKLNVQDQNGLTLLHYLCIVGKVKMTEEILKKVKFDSELCDKLLILVGQHFECKIVIEAWETKYCPSRRVSDVIQEV
jgi:hypothetical protein